MKILVMSLALLVAVNALAVGKDAKLEVYACKGDFRNYGLSENYFKLNSVMFKLYTEDNTLLRVEWTHGGDVEAVAQEGGRELRIPLGRVPKVDLGGEGCGWVAMTLPRSNFKVSSRQSLAIPYPFYCSEEGPCWARTIKATGSLENLETKQFVEFRSKRLQRRLDGEWDDF